MPNELAKKGGQPSKPVRYAVLWVNSFYNGIVTQRNPLRGNAAHIEEEFYGSRLDSLLDGLNTEISTKLTLIRRPGLSVYNSNIYPAINRFYEYRLYNSSTEQIKVIADTAAAIYDVTGPGYGSSTPAPLFIKSAGAGSTYFQGVGNNLYFSDGVDNKKVIGSLTSWTPNTLIPAGTYIVDSNGNIQLAVGSQSANIVGITVSSDVATISLDPTTPLTIPIGTALTFSGLTTIPGLNGTRAIVIGVQGEFQVIFPISHADVAYTTETGAVSTGDGITGPTVPTWKTAVGGITQDGGPGYGATATSAIAGQALSGINLVAGGSNYTAAPTVVISGGGGSGATAFATLAGAPLTAINVTNGGSGYISPPTVTISGGGGSGAIAYTQLSGTSVSLVLLSNYGINYTSAPTVSISAPTSGTTATAVAATPVSGVGAVTLTAGGTGYTSVPDIIFSAGSGLGSGAQATAVLSGGAVTGITLGSGGFEYPASSSVPVQIVGGGGAGATATASTNGSGVITTLTLTFGGGGYTSAPAVFFGGQAQWENSGSQVQNWGLAGPTNAPSVTQSNVSSLYPNWLANTWYGPPTGFFVLDSNGNLQQLTTAGTTGTAAPTWNSVIGGVTYESAHGGTAVWTCRGTTTWKPNTVYTVGTYIEVTYIIYYPNPNPPPTYQNQTNTVWVSCTTPGTSGSTAPIWSQLGILGQGSLTDNTVVWTSLQYGGPVAWPGPSQTLSLASTVLINSDGYLQTAQRTGESAATQPTWNTTVGGITYDNSQAWSNSGAYSPANTGTWTYAYSYVNLVTDGVSVASPESAPILVNLGNTVTVSGQSSPDQQADAIYLWRTVQGGSVLFLLAEIPSLGAGKPWSFIDTTPDVDLNELIEAPIGDQNNPPPTGLSALTYYLQRIWGAVGNSVYYSNGPDDLVGNGNESWNPENVFVFPDIVNYLFPTANGLLVFTTSDMYVIQGLGTITSSFFSAPYVHNIGLDSFDAITINGTIAYLYTSDNQVLTLDLTSGASEIGFPIGDQFGPGYGTGTFNPASAHVTWLNNGSQDKALYVSDFSGTWWRMCSTPSPETGITWSPKAQIVGGFSAVQSVEVLPGTHALLVGPKTSGPILKRDFTVYLDNGSSYNAYGVFGSLVLAQPGQIASVENITTDSVAVGTPLTLAVQLDEIGSGPAGLFEPLISSEPDPTELTPSNTVYAQRFYLSQSQLPAKCRHMQLQVNWGETDTVRNELLSISIFGGFEQEK